MKQGDDLFQLIQSLSQSEKRYFKLFAGRHVIGDKNKYELLFDFIDEQTKSGQYNEEEIIQKLGSGETKNFASAKHYLYDLILRSMRLCHEERSKVENINQRISDIKFLIDKGLYSKCRQLIASTKKECYAIDNYVSLVELLYFERRMLRLSLDKHAPARFEEITVEENKALEYLQNELFYRTTYDKNFILLQTEFTPRNEDVINEIKNRLKHENFSAEQKAFSFNAKALFHIIRADAGQLTGDYGFAVEEMKTVVDLFEKNPVQKVEQATRYINLLNNYLNCCFLAHDFKFFPDVLNKLKTLKPAREEEEVLLFKNRYYLEMVYLANLGKWQDAAGLIPDVIKGLDKYGARLSSSSKIMLMYNIAVTNFVLHRYSDSLTWFYEIDKSNWKDVRTDLQNASRLFQIIIHYNLENYNVASNMMFNLKRNLSQFKRISQFEKTVFKLIDHLIDEPDKKTKKQIILTYKKELEKLNETASGSFLAINEVLLWIDEQTK